MKFNLLISQYDEHNESTLMIAKKFNIKNIMMIVNKEDLEKVRQLKNLYKEIDYDIEEKVLETEDYEGVLNLLSNYNDKVVLIDLTNGNRIISLLLLKYSMELNIQSMYVDVINKRRYVFSDDFRVITQQLEDMSIEEIAHLSGANIIEDSSYLCDKKELVDITNIILKNLELWHQYKQKLYDNNIFIHDYKDTSNVNIDKEKLSKDEYEILLNILDYLKRIKGIDFNLSNNKIKVRFKNDYLKSFLFKSGTWLEVLTKRVINEINDIDEVKSSVIFFWSEDAKWVKNEVDIVAVKDSILLCVSCKDSDKYDEDALNELQVYSEKLGGKQAIKILVATKYPAKKSVVDRAKEMEIFLVIIDKNINNFKKKLINILKK